jgi:hypothetical protein
MILPINTLLKFIRIFTLRNILKNAGKKYCVNESQNNIKGQIIAIVFLAVISITFIIILKDWIFAVIIIFLNIIFLSDLIIIKIHGNVTGIYENGIVDNEKELNTWNKIHSYIIKENDILGYYMNGELFEFKNIENIEEISNLFIMNNVKERERI